jgi:carbamoyltransferase
MNVLGISGLNNGVAFKRAKWPCLDPRQYRIVQGLDAAAALVRDGQVWAAAAEERFNGQKGSNAFPFQALQYCLASAHLQPKNIDYIAHGFAYAPYRELFMHDTQTLQQYETVYAPEAQVRCIEQHFPDTGWASKFISVPHHLAHAASAHYLSGLDDSLILIVDAMGEVHSTTVAVGRGSTLEVITQIPSPHSLGLLYGIVTFYLGFWMGLDEYKVMGLAPYGDPQRYFDRFMDVVNLKSNGTYAIPLLTQNYTLQEKETYSGTLRKLTEMFGPPRAPGDELTQRHIDIAAGLQATLQACILHLLRHYRKVTQQSSLCMAGGVALNCTANSVIQRSRMFKHIFVQPAAGDDGTALGAALYVEQYCSPQTPRSAMQQPLWGPEYSDEEIALTVRQQGRGVSAHFARFDDLIAEVVAELAQGHVVAWFQGRMEFGPRALGSRSILADPRDPKMRGRLNRLVKQREEFRPFAPAVTAEAASKYFEVDPTELDVYGHMLFVAQVRPAFRTHLPAVTHVDGSARLQVVRHEANPRFWALINAFAGRSNVPVVLNTSFNLRGQPIIRDPYTALTTFLASEIDLLVMGSYVIRRA